MTPMTLIDVLLHEHLRDIFTEARLEGRGLNAVLLPDPPEGVEKLFGGRGAVVRIETTDAQSLLVTPRRILWEAAPYPSEVAAFTDLVGYDWISPDLQEKVSRKEEHSDRLFLHLSGERTVLLDHLGDAVYPLMDFLAKVLEVRSQKVIRRRMDDDVAEVVSRCLRAAVEGPFFSDDELEELFEMDRASLSVLAGMWRRINLAAPELRRSVSTVVEMLLARREARAGAWGEWVAMEPEEVRAALEEFRRVVGQET